MPRSCGRLVIYLAAMTAMAAIPAVPAVSAAEEVAATVSEASLFKNGLAVIVRDVQVPSAGEWIIGDLPRSVHGSFWLQSSADDMVLSEAVAARVPKEVPTRATDLRQLLMANAGKQVEVKTPDGWVAGEVYLPPTPPEPRPQPEDRPVGPRPLPRPSDPQYILLRTAEGMLALSPGSISGVRVPGGELAVDYPDGRTENQMRLKVSGSGGKLQILCIEHGLTWAPSYQVQIRGEQEASVVCKAEVLNDIVDLKGASLKLVTGYPNLHFSRVLSPMAMVGDIQSFLASLQALERGTDAGAAVMRQSVMANVAMDAEPVMMPTFAGTGESVGDLFLYSQPNVTLGKGERAYYSVFAKRVPAASVYVWKVGAAGEDMEPWRRRERDAAASNEEVWHCLRLTNAGGLPWTTAPAMTTKDGTVLGQDTLHYTAPGAQTLLRITQAVQVGAEQTEIETDREPGAYRVGRNTYDIVHVKGTLRVSNRKDSAVDMEISKQLQGQVTTSEPEAKVETLATGLANVNRTQKLTWKLSVPAGETTDIAYEYKYYAAR
jgi:hypothetical protein